MLKGNLALGKVNSIQNKEMKRFGSSQFLYIYIFKQKKI